ncbi:MAG: hypothetical protein HKO65_05755 [Gemmatimonadetes bacterium]|nr:hypothetical protein [Gemmatimonadota bacterium]
MSLRAVRLVGLLLAVLSVVVGIYLFEGGGLDVIYPEWGWLLDGLIGGAFMGLGAGLGVTSVVGEGRWLDRLRVRRSAKAALGQGSAPPLPEGEEGAVGSKEWPG